MQRDVRDVGLERLAHALADELDQRVELELCRERLADAVHGRELGHALARLVDEPRVVERDAQAAGQRRQEPLVVLAEGVRAVDVLERDDAGGTPADDERDEQRRLDRLAAEHIRVAVALGQLRRELRRSSAASASPSRACGSRSAGSAAASRRSPRSITYGKLQKPARLVVDRDAHDLRVEDVPDLVADEVVDRLRVELAGDRRLDAVDERELGVALPRLVRRGARSRARRSGCRRASSAGGRRPRENACSDRGSGAR